MASAYSVSDSLLPIQNTLSNLEIQTAQVMQDPDLRALSRFYTGEPDPADWQDGNGGGLGPNGRYLYPPPPN
jgi:hypothetical protein